MKNILSKEKIWLLVFTIMPLMNFAQTNDSTKTYFSNSLFNTLLAVIILLVIAIVGMANVLKNLSQSPILNKKQKDDSSENTNGSKLAMFIGFSLLSYCAAAQNSKSVQSDWLVGGIDMFTFYFMMAIILLELICVVALHSTIKRVLTPDCVEKIVVAKPKIAERNILDRINATVELEREQEILLEHDYDGIKELDNDLPPWWKFGFYISIIVAFVYMIHYHIAGTGDLQAAEYDQEMAKAKIEVAEYMKTAASNVDETTVKLLESESDINSGKEVYMANCVACHGKFGEGGVGPNFADEFWVHGGSVQDIFKTVKYGYADKGMKSWKEDLSPMQIAQVTSFIRSFAGTNPPNGKAPQGEKYTDETTVPSDSTSAAVSDTLKTATVVEHK